MIHPVAASVTISLFPPFPVLVIIVLCVLNKQRSERESGAKPPPRHQEVVRRFVLHSQTVGIAIVGSLAAWALTGAHYFWPGWVALGGLITVALHAVPPLRTGSARRSTARRARGCRRRTRRARGGIRSTPRG